jgi:polyhydroxyalkanoate synthesis regulator phasin
MNNEIENIQITLDGFSEALSEIKTEIQSLQKAGDGDLALKADLLNKIVQTIDESKKGITAEELKAYSSAVVAEMRRLQDEANDSFSQYLNEKVEELEQIAKQPSIVENRYSIDFKSRKTFIALVIMALIILGLSYIIGEQRRSISGYRDNDLKYRYIKMQGQTDEKSLYRMEQQFKYSDSIQIICKQVGKYEELVREQAERIERAKRDSEEAERLQKDAESLKKGSMD